MDAQHIYGSPGTLYSRCGGVFGVAAFVDRCMDMWMQDDTLNANANVRTWHEKAQRCGFKFLVVQIVCNLTGGPQRYTGRPIDVAHKWLNISLEEWEKFMELFNEVCGEFNLPPSDIDDLNALMISMMDDCVTWPGDVAPPNPGPARPSGNSLYERVGGVYPIALFVDRLVDSVLADDRFKIPRDGQKRNEASLKYLVIELMCSEFGGPEVVTSRASDEVKLLVPKNCWPGFVATAQHALDHFPAANRAAAVQVVERAKRFIVDANSDDSGPMITTAAGTVKTLIEAASGKMLSKEVIMARHAAPGAHVGARRRVFGDPRTIYGKTGGVFGLARLVDRLMDVWMENPTLNGNHKVARWHQSQQKYGFKFLVAQLMGYLCGGPQRYTGRPMDESHQHLNITMHEWTIFVADADKVFTEFNLSAPVKAELLGIIARFQDQCVHRGREVRDPGRPPAHESSVGTLYHRLGGVYPIAQFADRVVELVLRGDRVHVDTAGEHRHAPGLKYMVTELFCHGFGGPEVATSKGFDDAKLAVPVEEWPMFLTLAAEAAEVFPTSHHRTAVVAYMNELKAEICVGIVSDEDADGGVGKLLKLGFPVVDATAALDKCEGNVERAKELLVNGWNPRVAGDDASSEFSRTTTQEVERGGGGGCPFMRSVSTASPEDQERARTMDAAMLLAEKGIAKADIAKMLGIDERELAALNPVHHGRALGSTAQEKLDELLDEDPDFCCPVMLVLYEDPVIASDGFIYERSAVETLIKSNRPSPMTREALGKNVFPARQKKKDALAYRETMVKDLSDFADTCGDAALAEQALERATDYLIYLKPKKYAADAHKIVQLWQKYGKPVPDGLVSGGARKGKGKG
jgi:hemoglobin